MSNQAQGAEGAGTSAETVTILYEKYRGETAVRRITPIGQEWFGSSEWHPERQWLFSAYDVDKEAYRDFAFAGIKAWGQAAVDAALASAPATPPGVPDSVRALSYVKQGVVALRDQARSNLAFYKEHGSDLALLENQNLAAYEVVLGLFATHPAGQSAGSGAVRDIGISGPVNGMNEPDPSGSYMRVVLTKGDVREERLISLGAAEVLNAELDGTLHGVPDSTRTGQVSVPLVPTEAMWRAFGTLTPEAFRQKWTDALAARPAAPEAQGAWRSKAADEIDAIADLWSGDGRSYAKTIAAILRAEEPEQLPPADAETKRQVQRAWDRFKAGTSAPPASSGQGGR